MNTDYPDETTPNPDDSTDGGQVLRFPRRADVIKEWENKGDDPQAGADEADEDHESVTVEPPSPGVPVDPPDEPHGSDSPRKRPRRPILPAWLRSKKDVVAAAKWTLNQAGYALAFHGVRLPKYAGKVAVYAPKGGMRALTRLVRWATAEEGNFALRQAAANRDDADTWLKLDMQRQREARFRWLLLAFVVAVAVPTILFMAPVMAAWCWWLALPVAAVLLAWFGRPADRPITDRVTEAKAYRKLTAELVRRALLSTQISAINSAVAKDPNAISFPVEIHRDGPGHLAIVDLPYGVEAEDVCARRGRLASGLRLPLDQVWPEPASGHTGRLALWVGYEPASQMRQPEWPLIREGLVDIFKPFPFATTPRLDVICAELMFRNWIDGGQPGSGKSFALRLKVIAAALDPRAELRGYELKGVGDFRHVEPVCKEYGNGFDDDTLERCAGMFEWLYDECRRRSQRIAHYAELGKAPENKVTPELASLKGSGLHPLVVWVDEIQELFRSRYGKDAAELAEKVIKLGRALGVILIFGTQIPDRDSLPPGITRNVNTRFCLSVADHVANDMILGTGAHKNGYRATVFEPVKEAGWGILSGLGKPGARRSFNVNNNDAAKVMTRAIAARIEAGTMPAPDTRTREAGPSYDVLSDVATVWPAGEDAVWNETLIERLTNYRPDVYAGWRPAQLTAALDVHRVKVDQIGRRINGKPVTRRGPKRADITAAIAERNRKHGGG